MGGGIQVPPALIPNCKPRNVGDSGANRAAANCVRLGGEEWGGVSSKDTVAERKRCNC